MIYLTSTSLLLRISGGILIASGTLQVAAAATSLATADQLQTGRTYQHGAPITYTATENGMELDFGNGTFPPGGLTMATLTFNQSGENGHFDGDIMQAGVNALSFGIAGSGRVPEAAFIELRSHTGRRWRYAFADQVSATSGERTEIRVPLTINAGWTSPWEGQPQSLLAEDLQHVKYLCMIVIPGQPANFSYLPAQSYTIDTVQALSDEGVSTPLHLLSPMSRALTRKFGYGVEQMEQVTESMREIDTDRDSMKDYLEVKAEHDVTYASELLELRWRAGEGRPKLWWPGVRGQTYRLLGASSIEEAGASPQILHEWTPSNTGPNEEPVPSIDPSLHFLWLEWVPQGYTP